MADAFRAFYLSVPLKIHFGGRVAGQKQLLELPLNFRFASAIIRGYNL